VTVPEGSKVLVVDDDEGCRRAVGRLLRRSGLSPVLAAGLAEAALSSDVACIVTEFRLPDGLGPDLLARAMAEDPDIGRVILTGVVDPSVLEEAVNRGHVHAFFGKPWEDHALVQGVLGVIERSMLSRENRRLLQRLEEQNQKLATLVEERTAQLQKIKQELQAIFDALGEPTAMIGPGFKVLRANRAYADWAGLKVRQVPGRVCHEALFGLAAPCPACPLPGPTGRAGPNSAVEVEAVQMGEGTFLCRYRS